MLYTLGVSGVSGGSYGPNGLYELLEIKYSETFIHYETDEANEQQNALNIIQIFDEKIKKDSAAKFNLIGYSMGGTVCLYVALYYKNDDRINKIIFCSTQTIAFDYLNDIVCPIVFFHPANDSVIPYKYVYALYELYEHEKKIFCLTKCDHDWDRVNLIRIIKLAGL